MEYLLLALLGIAMVVGSLAGFFSLFGKSEQQAQLRKIEADLAYLKKCMQTLETSAAATPGVKSNVAEAVPASPDVWMPATEKPAATQTVAPLRTDGTPIAAAAGKIESSVAVENTELVNNPVNPINLSETSAKQTPDVKQPQRPNLLTRGIAYAKNWLFGGNTLVRSGIVILFIGIVFLIKFAVDHSFISAELRLTLIALFGCVLLALGWRLRSKRAEYAWALQGGGVGVLYLTIFAAMKLYLLIPLSAAFVLLILVAFLSAGLAVMQSALPLAILGFAGGFIAPILTSDGTGNHVGLFSYYLVLNLAIALIAYFKSWRSLNVLGFAFTFIIGSLWGASNYRPELFASTEPFLIIHFLLFTMIAVLYAFRQSMQASNYVDATLVFGTPIVGFSLQYALLRDTPFGLAYSALALAVFNIGLSWLILTRKRASMQFLGECFLALGVGFATLTLPLALNGRWTSAAWAVEGVGLLWVGLKQQRILPLFCGLALQLLGAAAFAYGWGLTEYNQAHSNNLFLGVAFIALSSWACGALLNHYQPNKKNWLTALLAIWGWLWWISAGIIAIDTFYAPAVIPHAVLAFVSITSLLLPLLAMRLRWPQLSRLCVLLLPTMALFTCLEFFGLSYPSHPFAHYGYLSWPLAFAIYIWLILPTGVIKSAKLRGPVLWLLAVIGSLEWQYQFGQFVSEGVWRDIGWAIVPIALVAGISYWEIAGREKLSEPRKLDPYTWGWLACAPLMAFIVLWFIGMSLYSDGNAAPLPYLPLLNPLDISLAAGLLLLVTWHKRIAQHFNHWVEHYTPLLAGVMAFTLLNGMLLRTLHYWVGTPFQWTALFSNSIVQMAFTLLWALSAFALMLLAHKRAHRRLWLIGAALMALVVTKLFLLDLAQHGTVERIVSFMGAGLMLLVMGYFAPLPPAGMVRKEV